MGAAALIATAVVGVGVAVDSSEKQKTAIKQGRRDAKYANQRQQKLEKEREDRLANEQTLESAKLLRLRQGGSSVARPGATRSTVLGVPGGGRRTLLGE